MNCFYYIILYAICHKIHKKFKKQTGKSARLHSSLIFLRYGRI